MPSIEPCAAPDQPWADDEMLAQRLRNGDDSALDVVIGRYSSRVRSAALQILRRPSDADEVTQDVFLALWLSPDRFNGARGPLLTWLVILARSRALDLLRRIQAASRRDKRLRVEVTAENQRPNESSIADVKLIVRELLQRLPPQQASIIRRAYFEGYALAEIAEFKGLPLGTVKGRVRVAIKRLRCEVTAGKRYSA